MTLNAEAPHKLMHVYSEALEALRGKDLAARCRAAGYDWGPEAIRLPFLGRPFVFSVADFSLASEGEDLDTTVAGADSNRLSAKIIILHYLAKASGVPLSGRLVGFDQLAGGRFYGSNFNKRLEQPLTRYFAGAPEKLRLVARDLGGEDSSYGDVSVEIRPFPKIPMTLIVWTGDDEMPGNAKALFDDSVEEYLCTEDIAVLGDLVIRRLKELIGTHT